ncbi:hypothetical protein AN641_02295 [Candidatus Epulonipiscioides gigas]|nr:hypothetical protein AN641_02295 [Epulopiscium sp. SCG-C07WGA-EpuloA2]
MRKFLDLKYFKISIYSILVVACSILVYRISSSTDNFMPKIFEILVQIRAIFSSVAAGFIIAYLMNPSMNFFERHLCKVFGAGSMTAKKSKRIRRFSIGLVYLIFFGAIYLFIIFLGPQLVENISFVIKNVQANINTITLFVNDVEGYIAVNFPIIPKDVINDAFNIIDINSIFDFIIEGLNTITKTLISSTVTLLKLFLDGIISFMVAMYVLSQKETFVNGGKRFVYASFKKETAQRIIDLVREAHFMMIRFFVGKSLDSFIIGVICFVGLWLMKNPYALLLSLIVGIFNMIPYFGPFIGGIPAILITLFEGFLPALMVAIFILLLQQFDGLYLGPKILGDSLGITPFWIIASVTIGGKLYGAVGMFIACPIIALMILICNRWIEKRLKDNKVYLPKLEADKIILDPTPPYKTLELKK